MSKTYRKDQQFRPKRRGKVFIKDKKSWKRGNDLNSNEKNLDIINPDTDIIAEIIK